MTQVEVTPTVLNGISRDQMFGTLDAVKAQPELGKFQFRARNRWISEGHNQLTIKDFYGAGGEDSSRAEPFVIDAGEPPVLLGTNTGPNPAELLLTALSACLTTTLVNVAAARRVKLISVESEFYGDADLRGALGISDEVRNGFRHISVRFRIEADATPEKVQELVDRAMARSFVYDSLTRGVPVTVEHVAV